MLRLAAAATAITMLCAPAVDAQAVQNATVLNALGYAVGESVLVTHLAVGTLADAVAGKAFSQTEANNVLTTYINVTGGLKTQLRGLVDGQTLLRNDSTFVENAIAVVDLVLQESNDLKTYVSTGNTNDAQTYDSSRKRAYAQIKVLLGIKD